ncbi:hypothetical protein [Hydrogenophaga sp. BPS33]|uniref:hypothetical protein n=1 Tax=Hydrogenophaga sp. BPS33 TaxID=2651974 RepID=UPI00131FBEB1|nr:hypothetical protein [Hydrogenophaga sp. BPS33]QHE84889.1 hypothetical protein F9K07_08315 [Hydrogenophaga sp. BPS33]
MKNAIRTCAQRIGSWRTLCLTAVAAAGASILPATAQSAFDVVGVRPGMTEAEAMSALTAHRPGMRVQKRSMNYNFRDGVQQINTESFLHEVWVIYDDAQGREEFRLYFSPLPSASRVVSVYRNVTLKAPPTQAQLSSQLTQKYGAPTVTGKNYADLNMTWGESGKPMCWRSNPKATVIGDGQGDITDYLRKEQAKGRVPADFSQCGVALAANLVGEPVRQLVVRITDYGAWAATQQKAKDWVEQQRQDAVKARLSKGDGPKL